ACAFVYLLLAVWLSMHASIASHSFGVRLLTRFVRLPIPSPQQISSLSSRLADFEAQGLQNVLRLPGVGPDNRWENPPPEAHAGEEDGKSSAPASSSGGRAAVGNGGAAQQAPGPSGSPQSFGPAPSPSAPQ
ncbi:unnamed protein product, partial [Polarella glacialis]